MTIASLRVMISKIPRPYLHSRSLLRRGSVLPASLALVLAACGYAEAANYRYYRFTPLKLAGGGISTQISEFEFDLDEGTVPFPAGTTVVSSNSGADGGTDPGTGVKSEAPIWVTDGFTSTKWYNAGDGTNIASIVFDAGAGNTINANGYRIATGGDAPERTPVSWHLEGSNDNSTWTLLDVQNDYPTPTTNESYTDVIPIPDHPPASITSFSLLSPIVENGKQFSFTYTASLATSVKLNPGNLTLNPTGDTPLVTPPATKETAYQLTATTTLNPTVAEQDFLVRSVATTTQTYRYVRFTPLHTGIDQIDLASLNFTVLDAAGNLDHELAPVKVTYDGETTVNATDIYRPDNLRDDDVTTEWFSGVLRPVVFDFGTAQSFNHYEFVLSAFESTGTRYAPLKWRLEGSNDLAAWTTVDNVNTFNYPMPAQNNAFISNLPAPSNASLPLELSNFYATRNPAAAGAPTTLHWFVAGAQTLTVQTGSGTPVTVPATSSSLVVTPPAAITLYTLTATSIQVPTAAPVTLSLTLSPPEATAPALPNYPDLAVAGTSIITNGSASFINSFATPNGLTAAGDRIRLQIVPDSGGVTGTAYFKTPVTVTGGFDTTFDLYIATKDRGYGADGVSFVIQNTPEGTANLPASSGQLGPLTNAAAIEFSTWDNNAVDPAPRNEAKVKIYKNQVLSQSFAVENTAVVLNSGDFPVYFGPSFVGNYNSKSYKVHITYTAAKLLNVFIDDVPIVTDYTLDLTGATDTSGKAYIGFSAANGGLTEDSSLTSWVFSNSTVTPTTDL
ncbi:MAG: Legume lectin domain, partial [Akkermansiaceae bacterium]|nr:Legume lectin domain [Akkermansiaceae bacterium]